VKLLVHFGVCWWLWGLSGLSGLSGVLGCVYVLLRVMWMRRWMRSHNIFWGSVGWLGGKEEGVESM
jgi:hypothetical protein